jgi:hypothetical protein
MALSSGSALRTSSAMAGEPPAAAPKRAGVSTAARPADRVRGWLPGMFSWGVYPGNLCLNPMIGFGRVKRFREGLSSGVLVMWPLNSPSRWIRAFSLAGYLLSGIVATLAHDHAGSSCCHGPQPRAVSSPQAVAVAAKPQCGHSLCKKHAQAEASTGREAESGESGSISTRCLACDFLAQHVATPAVPVTPAVAPLRWSEASAHAIRCHAPVMAAFLARGPPA